MEFKMNISFLLPLQLRKESTFSDIWREKCFPLCFMTYSKLYQLGTYFEQECNQEENRAVLPLVVTVRVLQDAQSIMDKYFPTITIPKGLTLFPLIRSKTSTGVQERCTGAADLQANACVYSLPTHPEDKLSSPAPSALTAVPILIPLQMPSWSHVGIREASLKPGC